MSIDLERSLDELARSVHDVALAERMNGQVYRMVAQIKRRRAARYTGTSVIGMSAAAAVMVGGMQLAQPDDRVAPPATDGPDSAWPGCGATSVPDPSDAPDATFVLTGQAGPVVPYGEDVPVGLTLMSANAQTFTVGSTVQLLVLADGVVVGTAERDAAELGVDDGVDPAVGAAVAVVACAGDTPLNGGDYQMVATVTVTLNDGTVRAVVSDPLPFAIGPNPLEVDAAGQAAVADIVDSAGERADEFGVCGSVVPPAVDAPVTLELVLEERVYAADEPVSPALLFRATDALPDGAQLSANHPTVVLTRDDVIVATLPMGDDPVPLTLGPDATGVVPATGSFSLCSLPGADAPSETPLPAGTYQAYAVTTLEVHETALDGSQLVPWEPVLVRSEPVDFTLG